MGVIDGDFLSLSYALKDTARSRSEKEMIPVRKCARKEKREKATIQNGVLESVDFKYFNVKCKEKKKKMNPMLFGTEIAPK